MNRRGLLKSLGIGAAAGAWTLMDRATARSAEYERATRGLPPLKITRVKAIQTCPQGARLTVVKVETSEPGLYGLGCATSISGRCRSPWPWMNTSTRSRGVGM